MLLYVSVFYSFLWLNDISYYCTDMPHCYPLIMHLVIYTVLAIMNTAVMKPYISFCVDIYALISFEYIARSKTAESYGIYFWETARLFHSTCTILHSCQQRIRIPISSTSSLTFVIFPLISHSTQCHLIMVLICDLVWTDNDVEHIFRCLSAICMSLKKCLLKSCAHLSTKLYVFLLLY